MKTVRYPGGTTVRFQFNGIFSSLPPGLSEWPDSTADHLLRKFEGFGLRIVPSHAEVDLDRERQRALLERRNAVRVRSKRVVQRDADKAPEPVTPQPLAEKPEASEGAPVAVPSAPAEKKGRKSKKDAPEPPAPEEVQPVTPADGPGGES